MASASRKGSFSRSTRPRLIDPNGEYKAIRKVINTDCSTKQKCIISFDRSDLDDLENDYPVASITMKLINHSFDESFTPEDIQEVYPGTTEIALYVSEIPTRSVLLFKIENPSADDDSVEQRFFSAMLDLNHPVFKGKLLANLRWANSTNSFYCCFTCGKRMKFICSDSYRIRIQKYIQIGSQGISF